MGGNKINNAKSVYASVFWSSNCVCAEICLLPSQLFVRFFRMQLEKTRARNAHKSKNIVIVIVVLIFVFVWIVSVETFLDLGLEHTYQCLMACASLRNSFTTAARAAKVIRESRKKMTRK